MASDQKLTLWGMNHMQPVLGFKVLMTEYDSFSDLVKLFKNKRLVVLTYDWCSADQWIQNNKDIVSQLTLNKTALHDGRLTVCVLITYTKDGHDASIVRYLSVPVNKTEHDSIACWLYVHKLASMTLPF